MTKKELRELIRATIRENIHGGTGGGGNPTDGNNVTSPRPFHNDDEEVDNYMNKNRGEGGQGRQYKNNPVTPSYNRMKFPKF